MIQMAKPSTTIVKTDTSKVEFKSEGRLALNEQGQLVVETTDYGEVNVLKSVDKLKLLGENVEVKITLKEEDKEEIDFLELV